MRPSVLFLAAVAAFTLAGCTVVLPQPEMPGKVTPRHVAVLTENVEIRADGTNDGEWSLTSGRPQTPPFESTGAFAAGKTLLDDYEQAMVGGAQHVRVSVPQLDEPLFGVLRLGGVYGTTDDTSAKRVYRIQIPDQHVQAARGGQVSVVYQPYAFTHQVRLTNEVGDHYYGRQEAEGASWILWLSDAPFPGQSADPITAPTETPTPGASPDGGR